MAASSEMRPMSDSERAFLAEILKVQKSRTRFWRQSVENFVVMWAATTLASVVVWLMVAWLLEKLFEWHLGLSSPVAIWVAAVVVPICGAMSFVSTVRWVRSWPDSRPELEADLAGGVVAEERHAIADVKRYQEPEHGGLIYFLRTDVDQTLVLYDAESQQLGAGGQDPLESTFQPLQNLTMVRAPNSGFVIKKQFTGAPLELPSPRELIAAVDAWPENEEFSEIPWEEIDFRLGTAGG